MRVGAMKPAAAAWRSGSAFADAEGRGSRLIVLCFQDVAGLCKQGWNVDGGERVGAGHDQNIPGPHPRQRLAGPQYRQRTLEAAQIEGLFRHW